MGARLRARLRAPAGGRQLLKSGASRRARARPPPVGRPQLARARARLLLAPGPQIGRNAASVAAKLSIGRTTSWAARALRKRPSAQMGARQEAAGPAPLVSCFLWVCAPDALFLSSLIQRARATTSRPPGAPCSMAPPAAKWARKMHHERRPAPAARHLCNRRPPPTANDMCRAPPAGAARRHRPIICICTRARATDASAPRWRPKRRRRTCAPADK